jgi:hypothetical protein
VTQVVETNVPELAIVFKSTFVWQSGRGCRMAEEQLPLEESGALHDPLRKGALPSPKALPEVIGLKNGTDVIVRASARPARATSAMQVALRLGEYSHTADVVGRRVCEYRQSKLSFTNPESFEEMPLRYDNAYGGTDPYFNAQILRELSEAIPASNLRRARPALEAMFQANHPLMYPRNRFGKGYILTQDPAGIEGRDLPNIERSEDRLTPQRIVVENPMHWWRQPVPVGFDYLDPLSFPRSALMGMPPLGLELADSVTEVAQGWIPADFCRGNVFAAKPEQVPDLIHPHAARMSSLGLCFPFLKGRESLQLEGMDHGGEPLVLELPRLVPEFTWQKREMVGILVSLFVDVDQRQLQLIWVGRTHLARPLLPGDDRQIAEEIRVELKEVTS